jgi:hypothetical protein
LLTNIATRAVEPEGIADSISGKQDPPRKLSLIRRVIRGFDRLDSRYIEPQHYIFTAMLQATYTYDIYNVRSREGQSVTFAPDGSSKLGPYFGWRWFFAGYTFDLNNLNIFQDKQEIDLSIYSSQIGVDLCYRRTGSDYKLRNASFGDGIDESPLEGVNFDGVKAGITGINVYYIFNHGRFSYPAVFAQSTCQKISCGSWMAGIGYTKNSFELDYVQLQKVLADKLAPQAVQLDSGLMFNSVRYHDFNISVGYAYNWVFASNWAFGVSLQAALAYKKTTSDMEEVTRRWFNFENINLNGIGRFGLVYNNMRWYAGFSAIVRMNNYHKQRFSTQNTFGSMNLYVGYNFGLKKKYKEQ